MSYVLAIDQGTQSTRAAVIDRSGQVTAKASVPIDLIRRGPNRVEQDPEQIVRSIQIALDELLADIPRTIGGNIDCCGIATQRSTVLGWNNDDKSHTPALNWQDTRGWEQLSSLQQQSSEIKRISGLPLSAHYGATKLHWLIDNYKHAQMYGPLSSFLLSRIISGKSNLVDHANAQRLQLLDIAGGGWSQRLLELFNIDISSLPESSPIYHRFGELKGYAIPITAVNGDQNAAWFACGRPSPGTALVNIGSGAFILTARQGETDLPELLTTICFSDKTGCDYLHEATINGAGNALQWLAGQFRIEEYPTMLQPSLQQIIDPPIFLNTVGGLGSPWWQSGLNPVFDGDPVVYSQAELLASVCESILFLIYHNILLLQQSQSITELHLSGGLSQVDQMCQKLANLSNLKVRRSNEAESTLRGIAWIASGRPETWEAPAHEDFLPKKEPGLNVRFKLFIELLTKYIDESKHE